jgi:hypothetical protein
MAFAKVYELDVSTVYVLVAWMVYVLDVLMVAWMACVLDVSMVCVMVAWMVYV